MLKCFCLLLAFGAPALAAPIDLSTAKLVDLTHSYSSDTLYWPTSPGKFEHETLAYGETPGGYFYSSYRFSTPEHGGTHMDAPIHFYHNRDTVDQVPLKNLILPVVVIDIREQSAKDRNYRLMPDDIKTFEADHGKIPADSAVLLFTGWDQFWPDAKAYLGDDTPGDASNLSFPSFGSAAVDMLINNRNIRLIGIDTASIDYGPSADFLVHQIVGRANIPALENLKSLAKLPATGATLIALPIKISGGSGGPVRAIAIIP